MMVLSGRTRSLTILQPCAIHRRDGQTPDDIKDIALTHSVAR